MVCSFITFIFCWTFLIGNLTVLINFFTGSSNIIFKFFDTDCRVNIFYFPEIKKINFHVIIPAFITYLMIFTSTYNAGLSKDSDTYHLNNQLFIREESLLLGLSNLHHRYGFSSIWEYILSNFWFDNNLVFLNTPHLILLYSLYVFLIAFVYHKNLYFKKIAFIIALYGLLDILVLKVEEMVLQQLMKLEHLITVLEYYLCYSLF